jgi:PKD repeat protein
LGFIWDSDIIFNDYNKGFLRVSTLNAEINKTRIVMKRKKITQLLFIIVLTMLSKVGYGAFSAGDSCFAYFTYNTNDGTVYFADSSEAIPPVTNYLWNFGDSTSSTVKNPIHTYNTGVYNATVCLKVTNAAGISCTICQNITVRNKIDSCKANFSAIVIDSTSAMPLVRFADQSTGIGQIVSWNWTLSDSTTYTSSTFDHRFDSTLNYAHVCLTIKTNLGCQSTVCNTVYLPNKCQAGFSYNSQNGTVFFTENPIVEGSIVTRSWSFGDGTYSSQINPTHTYASNVYNANVCYSITTSLGRSCSVCNYIPVRNVVDSCIANFSYEKLDTSGSAPIFRFTDTSVGQNKITWRQWIFSDSTHYSDSAFVHQFSSSQYSTDLCLTIRTAAGCQSSICKTIILNDTLPVNCFANFSVSASAGCSPLAVYLTNQSSGANLSYLWNFGDGTKSNIANPVHNFYNFGTKDTTYTIRLIVNSSNGCGDTISKIIKVYPSVQANFNYTNQTDSTNSKTTYFFNNLSSGATYYFWYFGDGSSSTLKNPTHYYNLQPGSKVYVTLQARSNYYCIDTITQYITIASSPYDSCVANFTYSNIDTSKVYRFTDTSFGTNKISSRIWTLSDSTRYTDSTFVHMFPAGMSTANVCLSITTTSGCHASICKTISLAPVCVANFTYSVQNGTVNFYNQSQVSLNAATWHWDFGDSTTSALLNPVHTYPAGISRVTVCLSVLTATYKQSCVACKEVIVRPDSGCRANFTYQVAADSGSVPKRLVYFYDQSYSNSSITYRMWNFGDGYSQLQNPLHLFNATHDTTIYVGLFITTSGGCSDSTYKPVFIPGKSSSFSISGTVMGKNAVLPQGVIVLYKKVNYLYMIEDAAVISNGAFNFTDLSKGKYILYAMPHAYYSSLYYPTYYVNKLRWTEAQVIDLNSNVYGLTLKMVSTKSFDKGVCSIIGNVEFIGTLELSNKVAKSAAADVSCLVYLLTGSGTALNVTSLDSSGNFTFSELPFGDYTVAIDYANYKSSDTKVSLSPQSSVANDLKFVIDANALAVKSISKESEVIAYNVSDNQIAVRINKGGKYKVSLINVSGRELLNKTIDFEANADKTITVGTMSDGIYILKLQNSTNTFVKKIQR